MTMHLKNISGESRQYALLPTVKLFSTDPVVSKYIVYGVRTK